MAVAVAYAGYMPVSAACYTKETAGFVRIILIVHRSHDMLNTSPQLRLLRHFGVMAIGSLLYALAIYWTAILDIPGADNVQLRPGVVIPILCGAFFGPFAGFVSGFAGNLAADQLLGWGWWPFWYIGNGVMGLAAGCFRPAKPDYSRLSVVSGVVARAAVGITVGMGLASISEIWVTQSSWNDVLWVNFLPAFLSNLVNAALLVPIILLIYAVLRESTTSAPASV
jgi:energy-coupling factor transport system substrate-specific component